LEEAKGIVERKPIVNDTILPTPPPGKTEITVGRDREVVGRRDTLGKAERDLDAGNIGAAQREKGVQLDDRLQNERIFKGRTPVESDDRQVNPDTQPTEKRSTGVFDRNKEMPVNRPGERNEDRSGSETKGNVERPAPRSPRIQHKSEDDERPVYRPEKNSDDNQPRPAPQQRPGKRNDDDDRRPPVYSPPPQPKYEPPQRREEPRYEPPPRKEEPRHEPPPRREEPRNDPPAKPREESRPAPPPKREDPNPAPPPSKKDGRR
jgi:hypothetical protein